MRGFILLTALVVLASARPKEEESTQPGTVPYEKVAENETSDKESWRAFEPMVHATTHWWEEKLDDTLWDSSQYAEPVIGEPIKKPQQDAVAAVQTAEQQTQQQQPQDQQQQPQKSFASDGEPAVLPTEEEKAASVVGKVEEKKEDEEKKKASSDAKVTDTVDDNWSPGYRPGHNLNSFVDTETDSYYSPLLDNYNDKDWDKDDFYSSSSTSSSSEESSTKESSSEEKIETSEDILKEANQKLMEANAEGISKAVMELSKKVLEKSQELAARADQSKQEVNNNSSSKSGELPAVPVVAKQQNNATKEKVEVVESKDKDVSVSVEGSDGVTEETKVKDEPISVEKKSEDKLRKKDDKKFEDWKDWDESLFNDYEDEDEEDDDDDAVKSEEDKDDEDESDEDDDDDKEDDKKSVEAKTPDNQELKKDEKDDDDDDDLFDDGDYYNDWEYEYDDEDDDDDDDDDSKSSSEDKDANKTAFTPTKTNKKPFTVEKKKKKKEGLFLDSMDYQGDQPLASDDQHYSKGVVYDSFYPHHKDKPSVKKDLTNPANHRYEEDVVIPQSLEITKNDKVEKEEVGSLKPKDDTQNSLLSKSVTHLGLNSINTEADASTSPNPPTTWAVEPSSSTPPTSKPLMTTDSESWDEEEWNLADSSQFLSYPIEFCKLDMECRAGRECVRGVCRCVKPEACAGHGKAVCGSDGMRYPSHCELHRTACISRRHIRVDYRGKCFKKEIEAKEKSWLMEQEALAQKVMKEKAEAEEKKNKDQEVYQFPQDVKTEQLTSDVKKAYDPKKDSTDHIILSGSAAKKECTVEEMAKFKEALLMYHCQKFVEPKCSMEVKTDRKYLSMLMFSYYDHDFDFQLTADELDDRERDEHFSKNIIVNCHLRDFVKFADSVDKDEKLSVTEFTGVFEPSSLPTSLPFSPSLPTVHTLATAGNGLELKCGLEAKKVVWKRHGIVLKDDQHNHQIMVFDDGALFFSKVSLHHIGNYTCVDVQDETKTQVHKLTVQTLPVLHVTPVTQTHNPGEDVNLRCHADGVPKPEITWRQGDTVVHTNGHFTLYRGFEHMSIHNADSDNDAGTYTCSAHNQAGTSEKSVSVTVHKPNEKLETTVPDMGTFLVFHSRGLTAYDPVTCMTERSIHGDFGDFKYIPDALEGPLSLCKEGQDCQWGGSVVVHSSGFIYVTQPDQNRVLMIGTQEYISPLQVIDTDERPEKLWYVEHLDQIWVLCTNNKGRGEGGKIIMVIRDASQHIQHRAVHMRPVENHFDLVEDVFIAPPNDLEHDFSFGFVSHIGKSSLHKLNLEDMSYAKTIDLSNFGCVPQAVAFIPIGGHIVVECIAPSDQHSLQIVMDYLTDAIVSTISLGGKPMVSPDSRHLVTVDEFTGKVTVSSVSDEGVLARTYEVTVSASISDTAFMPTNDQHGYNLLLSSADDNNIITMNLVTGKVAKLPGSQISDGSQPWHPSPVHRHIVSGEPMTNYFIVPSRSSLSIVNFKYREVDCEYMDAVGSSVMVFIPSQKTS